MWRVFSARLLQAAGDEQLADIDVAIFET